MAFGQPVDGQDTLDEEMCELMFENCLADFHYTDMMNIDPVEWQWPAQQVNDGAVTLRNIIFSG